MLSDTNFVVVLHVLQHHGLRRHTGSPHGELSILCTRSDAGEGRMRVASWLQDFNERLRGSRRAHFNGLDVGHGAPRGRKMPTATSSCSRCATAKIIAGFNHEVTGTAWPARGAVCGHGSHAAAAARRQRIWDNDGIISLQTKRPDAGVTGYLTTRVKVHSCTCACIRLHFDLSSCRWCECFRMYANALECMRILRIRMYANAAEH